MSKILKVLGLLAVLAIVAIVLAWWWYLRADSMETPALPGTAHTGSLQYEGHRRTWLAYTPASKPAKPALVLVMHGSLGDGLQMRAASRYGFDVLAERHGFVAVYPDGYQQHWNDCRGSANYTANTENIDDVGFLRALVQQMVEEQGVDAERVYATGLSNGGQMAYRLGLEAPGMVAGIAAIAANLSAESNFDCEPTGEAVPALVMNGTADPVNPYDGGVVEIFGDSSRGAVRSSVATAAYWAGLAGYDSEGVKRTWPTEDPDDPTSVESLHWSGEGRVPVSLVTITGGGHTVPHPVFKLPRILGPTSHQLDGPEVIWAFFSGAELPPQQ